MVCDESQVAQVAQMSDSSSESFFRYIAMSSKSSMFLVNPRTAAENSIRSRALTSWKHVAFYMGKGVRTVQRWERFGLPIRRPSNIGHKSAIIAYTDELNAWAVTHYSHFAIETPTQNRLSEHEMLALPPRAQIYIRELEERISRFKKAR